MTGASGQSPTSALVVAGIATVALIASGIQPHDRFTWFLEVLPVIVGLALGAATYRRFPLTPLLYWLLLAHALILLVGGHYTYARVPLGFWFQEWLDLSRNHYDRLGHVAQGFVPVILAREVILRNGVLAKTGGWLWLFVTAACLAFSAFYEMLEWWVAVASGDESVEFLATQGDVWDTQWDMFLCLCGALAAQALLGGWHDRQLRRFEF